MVLRIFITILTIILPTYCQEEKYYVEIVCSSEDEVCSISGVLNAQSWIDKEKISSNSSFILIGPYNLDEINNIKERISQELNLPCSIYVDINKLDDIEPYNLTQDLDDNVYISSSAKVVSEDILSIYNNEKVKKIIRTALELYTTPYKWGGTNIHKGIDCSFFVQYVFMRLGIKLPRTSREQFKVGKFVEKDELKCGDLVFFKKIKYRKVKGKLKRYEYINHVGIYLMNGEFIHATINSKKVTISSLDEPYFKTHYAGARRVLKDNDL